MALSAQEQAELEALEKELGGLTPEELDEMRALEAELSGVKEKDVILNEMPEGLKGRFVAKNFGADPVAVFNYLQKENPDFELKTDAQGEIIARKRGTKEWGRLDPQGFEARDLLDIAYDVPAGIAQGLATAKAGIAGGLATGGIGAIPAGIAASGATGAGLEALRQQIGQLMGIEGNISTGDIGIAGAAGAASPLVFGTGAAAKPAIKAAMEKGVDPKALLKGQSGLVGRAWDTIGGATGRKLASFLGGYNEETLKALGENLDLVKAAQKNPEAAVVILQEGKDKILRGTQGALAETGQALESLTTSLDSQGAKVKTADILSPIKDLQERLKTTGIQSEERKALIARLEDLINDNFAVKTVVEPDLTPDQRLLRAAGQVEGLPKPKVESQIPEYLTATQANEAYFALKSIADDAGVDLSKMGQLKGVIKSGGMNDMRVARAFNEARAKAKEAVKEVADTAGVGEEYRGLNASYAELKEFQNTFNNALKDEESLNRFLRKRGATSDYARQKVSEIAGEDVTKLGAKLQAVDIFSQPGWEIPALGTSNTGRTGMGASLGGLAGYMIGRGNEGQTWAPTVIGATLGARIASPKSVRGIMSANQAMRQAPQNLTGYQAYPYLMMNPILTQQPNLPPGFEGQ